MSSEWPTVSLSDIAQLSMGETILSKNLTGDGIPVFSANTDEGPWGYTSNNRRRLQRGDLVVGARGSIGFPRRPDFDTFTCTQTTIAVQPDRNAVDSEYLHHALCATDILGIASQQAVPMLTIGSLSPLEVVLPPLKEQLRIAEVLRSMDEAIAATQRTLQVATVVRQVVLDAMVQQVLDDPKTEVRTLSDIAEVRTGLAKNKNRTGPKVQMPYLRVANVQDGWFDLADMQDIEVDPGQVDRYLLQAGDVLLTEGGDYDKLGRGGVWHGQITPCLHQNHVFCVRPDTSALLPEYFALATQSAWGRAYFLTCAKRTTNLASINSSQLRAFPVPVVPTPTQATLIAEVAAIDAMIDLKESQLETLSRLRAGVSSDLLSGRVRVPA